MVKGAEKDSGSWIIYFYLSILIAIFILNFVYVYSTRFERTITIKEKYNYASGGSRNLTVSNTVMDETGNVYVIGNSLPLLHFTAAEILMKIEKDKTYRVQGYGWRIPILGMFPRITKLV